MIFIMYFCSSVSSSYSFSQLLSLFSTKYFNPSLNLLVLSSNEILMLSLMIPFATFIILMGESYSAFWHRFGRLVPDGRSPWKQSLDSTSLRESPKGKIVAGKAGGLTHIKRSGSETDRIRIKTGC
jgi:hypothetical protein